jgi:hypothetical protein
MFVTVLHYGLFLPKSEEHPLRQASAVGIVRFSDICAYFRDFLDTDFKRQAGPKRSITLKDPTGNLTGIDTSKYPELSNEVWRVLRTPIGDNQAFSLTVPRGRYRAPGAYSRVQRNYGSCGGTGCTADERQCLFMRCQSSDLSNSSSTPRDYWCSFKFCRPGFLLATAVGFVRRWLRVEIYINHPAAKAAFESLQADRPVIAYEMYSAAFGQPNIASSALVRELLLQAAAQIECATLHRALPVRRMERCGRCLAVEELGGISRCGAPWPQDPDRWQAAGSPMVDVRAGPR